MDGPALLSPATNHVFSLDFRAQRNEHLLIHTYKHKHKRKHKHMFRYKIWLEEPVVGCSDSLVLCGNTRGMDGYPMFFFFLVWGVGGNLREALSIPVWNPDTVRTL